MFPAGLDGNVAAERVPDDARVELPLAFITSQLAQGRVAVPHARFVAAMPEALRYLLPAEGELTEVLIPLPEVFQSLPTGALNRRQDQLVDEVGPEIPTPFSLKAQEDAARLKAAATPLPEPEPEPEPVMPVALAEPLVPAAPTEPEPVFVEEALAPEPAVSVVEETFNAPAEEPAEVFAQADEDVVAGEFPTPIVEEFSLVEAPVEPAAPVVAHEEHSLVKASTEPAAHVVENAAPVTELTHEEHTASHAEAVAPELPMAEAAVVMGEPLEVPTALVVHEHTAHVEEPASTQEAMAEEHVHEAPTATAEAIHTESPVSVESSSGELAVEAAMHPEPEPPPAPAFHESEAEAMPVVHEQTPEVSPELPAVIMAEEHPQVAESVAPLSVVPEAAELTLPVVASEEIFQPAPEPEPALGMAPIPRLNLPAEAFPAADQPERELGPAPAAAASLNGSGSRPPVAQPSSVSVEEAQEALRGIFMVDDDLDAKKVVKLISQLPGLKACAVMFADGLKLAGQLESVSSGEGFCAMTPPFFRRAGNFTRELNLGEIQCVTLQTERALLSFFMQGDICVSVQHAGNRGFLPGVREKLFSATGELAKMYAMPAATH